MEEASKVPAIALALERIKQKAVDEATVRVEAETRVKVEAETRAKDKAEAKILQGKNRFTIALKMLNNGFSTQTAEQMTDLVEPMIKKLEATDDVDQAYGACMLDPFKRAFSGLKSDKSIEDAGGELGLLKALMEKLLEASVVLDRGGEFDEWKELACSPDI
jgi:preprotein translocase subunit SecD